MSIIDTDSLSSRYRLAAINVPDKRLLITRLAGSAQESDLSTPANCQGYGRVRHFRRETSQGFPSNPLPIDPATAALGMRTQDRLRAQVFQSSICNWRCWYCYVPFELLAAHPEHSAWLSADDLVELYLAQDEPPKVIDLSGGQPDLTPEWTLWMIEALQHRGLEDQVYLWSDDNLSNDYFWRYLTDAQQQKIASYRNYGRVCCFKGFDANSFAFNTKAHPELFNQQFVLMRRLLELGLDLYAYVTFTAPENEGLEAKLIDFVDRLQAIDPLLPLRTVPLEIQVFGASSNRIGSLEGKSMDIQNQAVAYWNHEIERRFSLQDRTKTINEVKLASRHQYR